VYLVGNFNNLQYFILMKAVNTELTHPVKIQIIKEKPYFSEPNYKSREIINIAYYLHQIYQFQYKCGFSVSPHLRLLVLDSESRNQGSIEGSRFWICGGNYRPWEEGSSELSIWVNRCQYYSNFASYWRSFIHCYWRSF